MLVDAQDVLADGQRRHAVHVVRDATEQLRALAGRERLPPGVGTAVARVHWIVETVNRTRAMGRHEILTRCPVHQIGSTLCTSLSERPR